MRSRAKPHPSQNPNSYHQFDMSKPTAATPLPTEVWSPLCSRMVSEAKTCFYSGGLTSQSSHGPRRPQGYPRTEKEESEEESTLSRCRFRWDRTLYGVSQIHENTLSETQKCPLNYTAVHYEAATFLNILMRKHLIPKGAV